MDRLWTSPVPYVLEKSLGKYYFAILSEYNTGMSICTWKWREIWISKSYKCTSPLQKTIALSDGAQKPKSSFCVKNLVKSLPEDNMRL